MTNVIVNRPVAFIPEDIIDYQLYSYMDIIDEFHNEYQTWITDNFGYEARYEHSYTMIEGKVYFVFEFKTEEDAMAFKLRWL